MDIKTRIDAMLSRKFILAVLGIIVVTIWGADQGVPTQWIVTMDTVLPAVYMIANALGDKWSNQK